MKGRGVRTIDRRRLPGRHPRRHGEDAVRASSTRSASPRASSSTPPPLDRKPTVPLEKLLRAGRPSASATRTRVSAIAARLAAARPPARPRRPRRSSKRSPAARRCKEIAQRHRRRARPRPPARRRRRPPPADDDPTVDEIAAAAPHAPRRRPSRRSPTTPSCASGSSRCAARYEQVIDETSADERASRPATRADATDRARATVESWEQFCDDNRDEITALQILYAAPYSRSGSPSAR